MVSLVGVFILAAKEKFLEKLLLFLVTLSAGGLLGGAIFHLLPESILNIGASEENILNIFVFLAAGFCIFFIFEQFLGWHHCHKHNGEEKCEKSHLPKLVLVSDSIHNFIDGIILAASFLVSLPTGIAATIAVILHEIPQELGDFGVLVYGGMTKKKALSFNFLSALTAVLGGIVGYFVFSSLERFLPYVLAFMAGHFIYIASSDLIPEIKEEYKKGLHHSLLHFLIFLLGLALMFAMHFIHE